MSVKQENDIVTLVVAGTYGAMWFTVGLVVLVQQVFFS